MNTICLACGAEQIDFSTGTARKRCPKCNTAERVRLTHLYFKKFPHSFNNLLHIAPEPVLKPLFTGMTDVYVRGDLAERPDMIQCDIRDLNFEDNHFDALFVSHVLEHVKEDRQAISECFRVLKPGGKLFTMVPLRFDYDETHEDPAIQSPEDKAKYYGDPSHVRAYGPDFSSRLAEPGFYVKMFYVEGRFDSVMQKFHNDELQCLADANEADQYGVFEWDVIFECVKPQ